MLGVVVVIDDLRVQLLPTMVIVLKTALFLIVLVEKLFGNGQVETHLNE